MNNIKGFAIATDGNKKRIAITYDELDDIGNPTSSNNKKSIIIMDENVLSAVTVIESYAQMIVDRMRN